MKKIAKKRCEICHQWFSPHPRAPHQRCCSNSACRKERKTRAREKWWAKNPDYGKGRKSKVRAWAKAYPNYWGEYRQAHPDYTKKERQRMRSVRKKAKTVAKQDAVRKTSVEKLESILNLEPICVAKQDAVQRRVNGILDYLFWKESVAKQDGIAYHPAASP
ncbi:MAG: hypothetical protein KJ811_02860 [Candidatus Margulisbacteria bacterium]|nr:hypothetical protein [Candidatus Margulisiibacteriota bacterium]